MKFRFVTLTIFAVLIVAALYLVLVRMTITSDMSMLLPDGASTVQRSLVEVLRKGVNGKLILVGLEGAPPDVLAETNKALARALKENGLFSSVNNGPAGLPKTKTGPVFAARYLLSSNVVPGRFGRDKLREALQQRLKDLASAAAPLIKPLLPADPTGEFLHILRSWVGERDIKRIRGVYFSHDQQRSLLLLTTRGSGIDLDRQVQAVESIHKTFAKVAPQGVKLLLAGPPIYAVEARRNIRSDVHRLSIAASLIVIGFLYLAFRSFPAVVLSAIPLFTGVLSGMAAVTLFFGTVHGITIAFGSTLIGITVDYPMHFFSHLVGAKRTPHERLQRIWPTLRLGVLTTIIGFSALIFSAYGGLAQLGVFSIAGLAGAALATRHILPIVVAPDFSLSPTLKTLQQRLKTIALKAPRAGLLLAAIVAASAVVLVASGDTVWEDDLAKVNPLPPERKRMDRLLREALNAPHAGQLLMVIAASEEAALRQNEALMATLDQWIAEGKLDGYESAARFLPSRATQKQRQAALPSSEVLRANLAAARDGLPFKRGLFEPFVQAVQENRVRAPLTSADFADSVLGERLDTLLFSFEGKWFAPILLYNPDRPAAVQALAVDHGDARVVYVDIKQETSRLMAAYRERALWVFVGGGVAILAVLILGLGSMRRALRVFVAPAGVVIVDSAALLLIGDGGLTIFHLISLLLVVGLGIDYALFFNRLDEYPEEWDSTFPALWKSWLTTVLVFGSLTLSSTTVLQTIGLTVSLGVTLCLVFGAVWARRGGPHPAAAF